MSEREVISLVQIGHRWVRSASSSVSIDGSIEAKGSFSEDDLKVNKSKSEPKVKPEPPKDHMLLIRKPETVNKIGANIQSEEVKKSKADLKPEKIEEIKAFLKPDEVAQGKSEPKTENVEESNSDLKLDKLVERTPDLKPDQIVESNANLKPAKIVESTPEIKIEENKPHPKPEELQGAKPQAAEENKANMKTVKVKKGISSYFKTKSVKKNNAAADSNIKVAEDKKSGDTQKKGGVLTRTLQWFSLRKEKRMAKRKEKKAAKKAKKEEAKSVETDPRFTEEEMWAEILKLESEINSLQEDHEVAEAEWRHLMVAKVRRTKYLEKLKRDRAHSAQLEEELGKVLWAQMDLEEKSLSVKQRLRLKIARMKSKPRVMTAGTQTDGPCTEELYSKFLAYKDKVAKMKAEIVAQTDELEYLERDAETRRVVEDDLVAQTEDDIRQLQMKLEQLTREPKN